MIYQAVKDKKNEECEKVRQAKKVNNSLHLERWGNNQIFKGNVLISEKIAAWSHIKDERKAKHQKEMFLAGKKNDFSAEDVRVGSSIRKADWRLLQENSKFEIKLRKAERARIAGNLTVEVCIAKLLTTSSILMIYWILWIICVEIFNIVNLPWVKKRWGTIVPVLMNQMHRIAFHHSYSKPMKSYKFHFLNLEL